MGEPSGVNHQEEPIQEEEPIEEEEPIKEEEPLEEGEPSEGEEPLDEEEPMENECFNEQEKPELALEPVVEGNIPETPLEESIDPVESDIEMWAVRQQSLTFTEISSDEEDEEERFASGWSDKEDSKEDLKDDLEEAPVNNQESEGEDSDMEDATSDLS